MNSDGDTATTTYDCSTTCYRPRLAILVFGVVCTMFFLVMDVGSVVVTYWNIDGSFPYPKLTALVVCVFWSCWVLFSLWMILTYHRTRVYLSAESVTQHGVVARKTISVPDVVQLAWRTVPLGGGIVIRSQSAKIKIDLYDFASSERRDLIQLCRDTFPDDIQEGWSNFNAPRGQRTPEPLSPVTTAVVCALLLCGTAGACISFWAVGYGTPFLVAGLIAALGGMSYLCRILVRNYRARNRVSA